MSDCPVVLAWSTLTLRKKIWRKVGKSEEIFHCSSGRRGKPKEGSFSWLEKDSASAIAQNPTDIFFICEERISSRDNNTDSHASTCENDEAPHLKQTRQQLLHIRSKVVTDWAASCMTWLTTKGVAWIAIILWGPLKPSFDSDFPAALNFLIRGQGLWHPQSFWHGEQEYKLKEAQDTFCSPNDGNGILR